MGGLVRTCRRQRRHIAIGWLKMIRNQNLPRTQTEPTVAAVPDPVLAKIDAELTAIGMVLAARALSARVLATFDAVTDLAKYPSPAPAPKGARKVAQKQRYLQKCTIKLTPEQKRIVAAFKEEFGPGWIDALDRRGMAKIIADRAGVTERTVTRCQRDQKFRRAYSWELVESLKNRLSRKKQNKRISLRTK